jgi:branched-chain amino acid transport system permease protein
MKTASSSRAVLLVVSLLALVTLPFWAPDEYKIHLATLIAAYWILIGGLNLAVGYTGLLSIGHVGLFAIGAYAFAILAGTHGVDPYLALAAAGGIGGLCGLLLGLPSLRLPGFYFAMATMAFGMIVGELSLAFDSLTGGGAGISVPGFPAPFDKPAGVFWLVMGLAVVVTVMTWNVARLMWGRSLIALRDSEVAAAAVGIPFYRTKLAVYAFSGVTAGVGGAVFASLQSYITPETFVFDLGMFFFICIIIGGRGSILGPLMGTIVLTALPEVAAPLAKLGQFFYGIVLLLVVLLVPEGIGSIFHLFRRQPPKTKHVVKPELELLSVALRGETAR